MTPAAGNRRPDPQARREALAAAAAEVIAEVGTSRATHRAIAAKAGLPLGATTYYFPTRDDLVRAGLEHAHDATARELASWADQLNRQAPAGRDDPVVLAEAIAELAAASVRDRRTALLEYDLYLAAGRDPVLRPLAAAWLTGLHDVLTPYADRATAVAIGSLVDGAVLQALVLGVEVDSGPLAAGVRRLLTG